MPKLERHDVIAILRSILLEPAIRLSVWVQRRLRLDPTARDDGAAGSDVRGLGIGQRFRDAYGYSYPKEATSFVPDVVAFFSPNAGL